MHIKIIKKNWMVRFVSGMLSCILFFTPISGAWTAATPREKETMTRTAGADNTIVSVSLNNSHSAVITKNGDLYCWGRNEYGQVGNGTKKDQTTPIKILSNVDSVSLGVVHSAAITKNGDLYCWGQNEYGQVGNGTREDQLTPVKILSSVDSVSLGWAHNAAITKNGDLYCWGENGHGQVGNGTREDQFTPVKILSNVDFVSLDYVGSAAITKNGDLYCWGRNYYGQVGNGTEENQLTPVKILSNVDSVSLGCYHSAAITKNGDLYCWGRNYSGQVGNGTEEDQLTPVKILSNVDSVSLGWAHNAAITKNGDLYCWGQNQYGQVGNGTGEDQLTPDKILSNVDSVSLGIVHSAAITKNGDLYCWGGNGHGQVGNGTEGGDQFIPDKILSNVDSVSLDIVHSAAITKNGDLYCWGRNEYGEVGNGTREDQLMPVKISCNLSLDNPEPLEGNKLQCASSRTIKTGQDMTLPITAHENSLDKLKSLTSDITWKSEDESIATIKEIGFILPMNSIIYSSENGSYETWRATGIIQLHGISKGITTITGTASDGSTVTCLVAVIESKVVAGGSSEGDGGGSLILGEDASGSDNSSAADFFPANWSLQSCVFPVEISKSTKEDGSYTIRGTVGIGKGDWLDDDAIWNMYKKNVSEANKYTGKVNCLEGYREAWGVKSLTTVSTDKFELLPELSVMGYFENTYDKNNNLISSTGKLASDLTWSGSISWQFVTPIGPLYLNLSGSGKVSGEIEPKYDYVNKSLKVVDGSLVLTPSVSLEGGYGIDKVATIGAQGTLSVPITLIPATKGEFEAKASLHVKLIFVIDYTHDLATYKTTLWDTTKKGKNGTGGSAAWLSKGRLSEMDTSFSNHTSAWNPNVTMEKFRALSRGISDTTADNMVTLQEGVLPSSLPLQAKIGDKNVMVFQAYDDTRTTLNSTVLKYSVLENGAWSEPKAVLDNGCADMYADMKVVNDKLVLVWQKEKKQITGDVETDSKKVLNDIAQNSEIYFSVFDEETNTFINSISVTDNSYYDMMPQICEDSDDIIVSWVRNDEADLMQETGSNTIYTAKWNGASFDAEMPLSKAPGTVDDYVVYEDEASLQSIFTGQANNIKAIFNTNGDVVTALSELMMEADAGTISGLNYTDGKVNFISKGTLYTYDVLNETLTSSMAGESAFGSEVQYCSNGEKSGYIWSIYDEETNMGRILASMVTENGYSEPITICEKENAMWRYFSPIIDSDGNWQIVTNVQNTETDINSLLYVTKKTESKLELAGASINENDVVDGLTGIDYFVTNTEDTVINNIEIEIRLEDGSIIKKTVPVTIQPGESMAGTAYVDLTNVDTAQNVTLIVASENQEDKSDCIVTDQIGQSDISVDAVSSETDDEVTITATLKNLSSVNTNATLRLYSDEKKTTELKKQEKISLKAKGSTQIQFTIKKKDIAYNENRAVYLTLDAVAEAGDFNEDNNTAYVILYQEAAGFRLGDVDHDGKIAVADALAILMHLADKEVANFDKVLADVDKDGKVAVADALAILMHLADKKPITE